MDSSTLLKLKDLTKDSFRTVTILTSTLRELLSDLEESVAQAHNIKQLADERLVYTAALEEQIREAKERECMNNSTIYAVAELVDDGWREGDFTENIDPDYGYFTSRDEAQQYVDSLNAPILDRQAHRMEVYEAQVQAWTKKSNEARKLGFGNPDFYPTSPGPLRTGFALVEINPHEATS